MGMGNFSVVAEAKREKIKMEWWWKKKLQKVFGNRERRNMNEHNDPSLCWRSD